MSYLGSSRGPRHPISLDAELPLEADAGASWRIDSNGVNSFFFALSLTSLFGKFCCCFSCCVKDLMSDLSC